jgi:hypothetical protein
MFSKLLMFTLTLLLANGAFAEDTKKPDAPKTWKDKLILSYHGEFGFVRKDSTPTDANGIDALGDLSDFTQFHMPTIGYKLTDSVTLTSTYEFRFADHKGRPKFANRFYRALLSLSKTNMLTEKEYGFQLYGGIARRYFDRTAVKGTYGNNRVNLTFTKNFDKNNASLFLQYLENDPKSFTGSDASTDTTWRRGLEIIPTINIQLTDKLSYSATDDINLMTTWYSGHPNDEFWNHEFYFANFSYKENEKLSAYFQLKYNHVNDESFGARSDDFVYFIGTAFSVTPKLTVTAEMGSQFMVGSDNKLFSEALSKPEFTLYLDAAF